MDIGNIQLVDIDEQMRGAYLDYAMSVIVARALPDARDGLKPVHRRILYAMHDMGLRSNGPYKKSARIVGEVLGKYHPHGDMAVYDSMARMAQDFSMRYLLVDGQGNFGSVDGDAPAAMRYTEARLGRMAEEMLLDIEKETVGFAPNFDDTLTEPEVLPAKLPNLLLNGTSGIAVGMATNIPPHNLREVAAAVGYLIDREAILAVVEERGENARPALVEKFELSPEQATAILGLLRERRELTPANGEARIETETVEDEVAVEGGDEASVEELMVFIHGPDFPTGGLMVGMEGIRSAHATGKGRIVMRAAAHIEELGGSRHRIVITEIPFQVNKSALLERIAELVRDGRIDQISDLRDESDRRGMSIVVELKKGAQPRKVLNQLFKFTPLQTTFGVQLLALVDGEPRLLSLKRALQIYVDHRREVITRRSEFELRKARARAHILDGLLVALANLDAVIKTIRESPDTPTAKERLMARFKLSEPQAEAILDMQLRRLAALERQKIEDEHKQVREQIAYLEDLLAHPKKILQLIKSDLNDLAEKYGDERRTRFAADGKEELREEDLVPDEAVLISITERGYVKRVAAKAYRAQSRGGRGVTGHSMREEDEVVMLFPARTLNTILFFSDKGKVYSEKAYQIPDADRADKGIPLANVLAIESGEQITAAVAVPNFDLADYCVMVTRQGRIKRVALSEFASVRPSGLIAISLDEGDVLGWVRLTTGDEEIILVTELGQALRFGESAVRTMGRQAAGVTAIRLQDGDFVTSMEVVDPDADLLVVTSTGYGKRTPLADYSAKGRATGGVATIAQRSLGITGRIASARVVRDDDDLTIISASGIVLRTKVANIRRAGRATMGTRLISLKDGDSVASVARIAAADLRGTAAEEPEGRPARAGRGADLPLAAAPVEVSEDGKDG